MDTAVGKRQPTALLGDTAARDYSRKLQQFNRFAEPELRALIRNLGLTAGMRVLDAGCGTGEALNWLRHEIGPRGWVEGVDLAEAHVITARATAPSAQIQQADLRDIPAHEQGFDLIWSVNTVHHLSEPRSCIESLASSLRHGGRIALGQSAFLPDMIFAWDARLETVIDAAVRDYYRERYQLQQGHLTSIRGLVGLLRAAGLHEVTSKSICIERISPLDDATGAYLRETVFRDTWGERLRPYLDADDFARMTNLCDPQHPDFALSRTDFHFLNVFTLVTGVKENSARQ